jgi:serine/threonine protein kinase
MKLENVLLVRQVTDDDETVDLAKVCDFGIAKLREGDGVRTRGGLTAGFVVGTPDYMSPEQIQGGAVDGRSDIYSVGVMLFHLVTGELPFSGTSPAQVMLAHIHQAPDQPSRRRPSLDPRFDAICLTAMAKDPNERYASARDMRRALRIAFLPEGFLGSGSYNELPPSATFAQAAQVPVVLTGPQSRAQALAGIAAPPAKAPDPTRAPDRGLSFGPRETALVAFFAALGAILAWLAIR